MGMEKIVGSWIKDAMISLLRAMARETGCRYPPYYRRISLATIS